MTPMGIFMNDPWWLVLIKVVALFVVLLLWTIFNVWYERRLVGKMQHRLGPIMNGPFGLGQALADGAKLIAKEDFRPKNADGFVFNLAPVLTGVAAFTCWTVIPFSGELELFGVTTRLQVADLPVSAIFILASASIGIYGIVLAGWAGNSTYSFLGSIRSTAQMISYEIAMGLSMVAVFLMAGSMSTSQIVEAQRQPILFALPWDRAATVEVGIQGWYFLLLFPSFIIYAIAMVGETNRAPFDLPECESELVSGYLTEYSGFRYAMFFLAEYINMATVSAVCTTLFLGGYLAPWPLNLVPFLNNPWLGPVWFMLKVQLLISVFVWLR
ncbi:MAG TPA: NADH-quinone oxidoreductase subunit H, partial [Arachnia sp.]|nr:NADH-quinone oxidoreductase subunit H [Arachnia sp.]